MAASRSAPQYWCRCPDCQCSAKTQHESHICYSCRGGKGVALTPREPAHWRKPRTTMPKLEPVRGKKR